ncbi:MAG: phosphatidylglycerophosphatase A [Candidatus Acidiferrales bacterium]
MNQPTDAPQDAASVAPASGSAAERKPAAAGKPRFALFIATACGLGYIPKAPGTWGSLVGVAFAYLNVYAANINLRFDTVPANGHWSDRAWSFLLNQIGLALVVAVVGLWAASEASKYFGEKDPQRVVVDEVSGQSIAYLGLFTAGPILHSWKYFLLGFILFRAFDIWKPFPARQAESLPGGWGIMADDWIAGIYAGIGVWIARAAGL